MKKTLILLIPFLFLVATPVIAQTPGNDTNVNVKIENPFKFGDNLYDVMKAVVNDIILPIGGVLCVLAFIFAGFKYVTAGGDKNKITDASKALLYAAIGTALLLGAWTIANVIDVTIKKLL